MTTEVITLEITGISPLLQNNPAKMQGPSSGVGTKKIPTPEAEAEASVYRNGGKGIVIPTKAFRCSGLEGCKGRRIGKFSAASRFAGAVFPIEEFADLLNPKTGKPITKYEIDTQRVVIQRAGILRSRPKMPEWKCFLALEVDTDLVSEDNVLEIMNLAGKIAGVGDYRPSCKGTFGRFTAKIV